jgi:hypothetical protein
MMPRVQRRRTPVILIGYGEAGREWLASTAKQYRDDPMLREFQERGIIQFWCVGIPDAPEPLHRLDAPPAAPALAGLLGMARSVEWTAAYPDLSVREVLVLERVSAFDPACAVREAVSTALLTASYVNLDAARAEQVFTYRWVSLLDAVRGPARQPRDSAQRARAVIDVDPGRAITLLVDRVDDASAEITPDYANGALQRVAYAYVSGDFGSPRADGGMNGTLPTVLTNPSPGTFLPFSIAELEHPWRIVEGARARGLREALSGGVEDLSRVATVLERIDLLHADAERDMREAGVSSFDPHRARLRRREHAEVLLAWAFAEARSAEARNVLASIRQLLGRSDRSPAAAHGPLTAMALVGWPDDAPVLVGGLATGAALLAGLGLWLRNRRRRNDDAVPERARVDDGELTRQTELRAELRREWEALCAQLDETLVEWDRVRASAQRAAAEQETPVWCARPPFAWGLADEMRIEEEAFPISAELCQRVAAECMTALHDGAKPAAALEQAFRATLKRLSARGQLQARALFEGVLQQKHTAPLRRFLANRPFLAGTARPLTTDSVVWLTSADLGLENAIMGLEPPQTRAAAVVLSQDSTSRTTRFAFAAPVARHEVQSLSFLYE